MYLRLVLINIFLWIGFKTSLAQPDTTYLSKREFRGVWVATVANIDWPSRQNLSTAQQQRELLRILDEHQQTGMNAILLQIRPAADALYAKSREPWSKYLTGKQGTAPSPFYDPLEFAIVEAHKRGMELHAWCNPYRAAFSLSPADVSANHISRIHPEWFFNYSGKKLFNPGIPEVRHYIVQVVLDIVKNYDVDGIHFDDYFYPYPEKNQVIPDAQLYAKYGENFTSIADWRRNNVDLLIKDLADSIHAVKRYVKFGISPFGIWQNKLQSAEGSETNGGSAYVELYADVRKWVKEGWIDYVNPQLYWPFHHRLAPFENLIDWWSNNAYGKHLYIGHAAYRAAEKSQGFRNPSEIPNQIRHLRTNNRIQGSVYFSSKSVTNNLAGLQDTLKNDLYQYKALTPQMIWLDDVPPQAPLSLQAVLANQFAVLNWSEPLKARDGETAYGYIVYRFNVNEEINIQDPSKILNISFDNRLTSFTDYTLKRGQTYQYVVTAIDRLKNESALSNIEVITYK